MKDKSQNKESKFKEPIDRLGAEWYTARQSQNWAVEQSKSIELAGAIMEWLEKERPGWLNAVGDFYNQDIEHFNPAYDTNNNGFFEFLRQRIKFRGKDVYNEDRGIKRNRSKNVERGSKHPAALSLDDEDNKIDSVTAGENADVLKKIVVDESNMELLSLIMQMPEKLTGRAKNETRRNYFRLFTTDYLTAAVKNEYENLELKHERDLLNVMKLTFLDFYMTKKCRTVKEIWENSLKKYGEVVEGQKMELLKLPLRNPVYVAYLKAEEGNQVGDSAVSMQRKAYQELLKELWTN